MAIVRQSGRVSRNSFGQSSSRSLWMVGSLCWAIALISHGWADGDLPADASSSHPSLQAPQAPRATPEDLLFSRQGQLQLGADGQLHFSLESGGGSTLLEGDGIESLEDRGDSTVFSFSPNFAGTTLQGRSPDGSYGNLHVRQVQASIADILQPPGRGEGKDELVDDDIYDAMYQLLLFLNLEKHNAADTNRDYLTRDLLLHANKSVVIRRANGGLDISLYSLSHDGSELLYLGRLLVDSSMRYQLHGPMAESAFQSQWQQTIKQLVELEAQITARTQKAKQLREAGDDASADALTQEATQLEQRFAELYPAVGMAYQFTWYGVTETADYDAGHWLKMSDEGGIHAAAQAVNYKLMSSMVIARGNDEIQKQALSDLLTYAKTVLDQTREGIGRIGAGQYGAMEAESSYGYLTRQLMTVWTALHKRMGSSSGVGYDVPAQYFSHAGLSAPIMRIRDSNHFVATGLTLQDSLQQIADATPMGGTTIRPDKIVVSEQQLHEMHETLSKSGWWAWFKSFVSPNAYQESVEATQLREVLARYQSSLDNLMIAGVEGGLPVRIINSATNTNEIVFVNPRLSPHLQEPALAALSKRQPKLLVVTDGKLSSEKLTDADIQQVDDARVRSETRKMQRLAEEKLTPPNPNDRGTLRSLGDKAWGTAVAAGTGMATGYVVQRGVDMASTYYNEGITPWQQSEKEAKAQHERAVKTGTIMAANAAVSHVVLPHVAEHSGYFNGLTGTAIVSNSLKGKYEASIAGGIAGAVTQSAMSGYDYWQGNIGASELAVNVADAVGRGVFTTAGSIAGHTLMPYSLDVPIVSSFLPIGNVGAVLGSVAGNVAYDTVKHYSKQGAGLVSDYYYGTEAPALSSDAKGE